MRRGIGFALSESAPAVADDEVEMRDCYERMLVLLGHRVVVAAKNGRELVEHCRRQRPDLIITDITMPEVNGDDAVAGICRDEPLPVIVLTAHHDSGRFVRSGGEHVTAYLIKPIGRKDLKATIGPTMRRFGFSVEFAWKHATDFRPPPTAGISSKPPRY